MRKFWFTNRVTDADNDLSKAIEQSEPMQFAHHHEAVTFLRGATAQAGALRDLRLWADRKGGGNRRSDRQLLEYAAACLMSRTLFVRQPLKRIRSGSAKTDEDITRASHSRASSPTQLRRTTPEPPPPQKAPVDVDKQIAALNAAAKSGAPFCEQCERAKAEAAA